MKTGKVQRFPALDGLRGYAALMVIVYHAILFSDKGLVQRVLSTTFWQTGADDIWAKAWLSTFNGAAAVELFFLLSGCVLIRSLDAAKGRWSLTAASFAIKRALRIYPGLIPCVAVTAAVSRVVPSWSDIVGNMALWKVNIVGASWTLQVEILAIPLMFALWLLHRKWGIWGILALLVVALVARKNPELFVAPVLGQYGYLFALGALVPSQAGSVAALWVRPIGWIPVAMLFLFLRQFVGGMDLETAALGFVFLALLYHDDRAATAPIFVSRVPQFLGKLSFGIYLWNVPFLYMPSIVLQSLLPTDAVGSGLIISVVVIPISIALAMLSYRLVEAPGIALGKKLVQPILSRSPSPRQIQAA